MNAEPCVRSSIFPTGKSSTGDLSERVKQPCAAIIREAVAEFLERHAVKSMESAYGLWGAEGADDLACQEKARTEW
jgi:hypothetical protein